MTTVLSMNEVLPLTCTRLGTCCHDKQVWLNPWELASMAHARGLAARDFREQFTDHGIRLRFAGACSQYDSASGCVAHAGRPLACRLYPLGREKRGVAVRYVHEGRRFPCLAGCPTVVELPRLSVGDYLAGQGVGPGEIAQDTYLEMAQDLAEGAFVVLFESGLAQLRGNAVFDRWRDLVDGDAAKRITAIGEQWLDQLTVPVFEAELDEPATWIAAHRAAFQRTAQTSFGALRDEADLADASVRFFALALHLLQAVGADPATPGRQWLAAARQRLSKPST